MLICTSFVLLVVDVEAIEAAQLHSIAYAKKQTSVNHVNYPNNIWVRIRNGFVLKAFNNDAIREHEISYTRHPKYIYQMIERGKPYLYHIVEEVERREIPTEIVLLPLIESAFDPKAESKSNALGLWQFIPSTGESYGLIQNKWHDDRRDVVASTSAALDYLQKLYTIFG
ncbi:MAG: transglycosylase SLT domain-containing protein, partial [Nitrosomonas sp.]|nr:transglycosylase SLT domain-containing protein [Nitrosomonas sp.]